MNQYHRGRNRFQGRSNRTERYTPETLAVATKERECLEAIENAKTSTEDLERRFPKLMVTRMQALVKMACDPEHRSCLRSQAMIRKIKWRPDTGGDASKDGIQVTLVHGRVDVPMPGTPGAPVEPDPEPPATGQPSPG